MTVNMAANTAMGTTVVMDTNIGVNMATNLVVNTL